VTRIEVRRCVTYALLVGLTGSGLSAAAQYFNAPGWLFIVISLIAFPLIGFSVAIQIPVSVVAGHVFGVEGGVLVTAIVLFCFFATVAFGQAYVWTRSRRARSTP